MRLTSCHVANKLDKLASCEKCLNGEKYKCNGEICKHLIFILFENVVRYREVIFLATFFFSSIHSDSCFGSHPKKIATFIPSRRKYAGEGVSFQEESNVFLFLYKTSMHIFFVPCTFISSSIYLWNFSIY